MAFILYLITAGCLLGLANRFVRRMSGVAAVVLLLLPLLFTGRGILTGRVYASVDLPYITEPLLQYRGTYGVGEPHNHALSDVASQEVPWRSALQSALARHSLPLLDPYLLCGAQLAGSGQPAAWSPFVLLSLFLPLGASLTYTATMAYFFAVFGGFLFARELGCRELVAVFAGAGWMSCAAIVFFALWPQGTAWALLPLVLLATRRLIGEPTIGHALLLLLVLTQLLLSGHPETVLHTTALGCVYALVELIRRRRDLVRPILLALGAGALALAISAIYLLPLMEAGQQTMEYSFRRNYYAHHASWAPPGQPQARALADLFPQLLGRQWWLGHNVPMDSFSVGSIVLALALYGAWRSRHRDRWLFVVMAVIGALCRVGFVPVVEVLHRLPLFNIAINERFAFAAAFALVMLAALGLEEFIRRGRDRALAVALLAVLVAIVAGNFAIDHAQPMAYNYPDIGYLVRPVEVLCLGLAGLAAVYRGRFAVAMILALLLGQRAVEVGDTYPVLPAEAVRPDLPLLRPIVGRPDVFRIAAGGFGLLPNVASLYELEDVRGYEAMTFSRYFDTYRVWCLHQPVWFNRITDLTKPFLSFLNVRYAIQSRLFPVPAGWKLLLRDRGAVLLENEHVLPRAFIPRNVRFLTVDGVAVDAMGDATDFQELAWINGAPVTSHDEVNATGQVRVEREKFELRLFADMDRAGWVVISEAGWKGWRAYVDGRRVKWFPANHAFIGLHVPAGHHKIRLAYYPDSFVVGRWISIAGLCATLAIGVVAWRRKKPAGRNAPAPSLTTL